jgi:hypothetical protein
MGLSYRETQCEALVFCVPWESKASGVTYRVPGYSLPPLGGESDVLTLWGVEE